VPLLETKLDDDRDGDGSGVGGLPVEGNRYHRHSSGALAPPSHLLSVLLPSQGTTVAGAEVGTHVDEGEREKEGVELGGWDLAIVVGPGDMIGTIGVRKKLRSVLNR
jgi:hypothetical protein